MKNSKSNADCKEVTRKYKALCAKRAENEDSSKMGQRVWLLDTGASDFMTPRRDLFKDFVPMEGEVTIGDGNPLKIKGRGKVLLKIAEVWRI